MNIQIFKGEKSPILSALTFNDAVFWGADAFVAVIFALYITQNIEGGTAIHVGLVFGLYRIVRAFFAIPIGRFLDKHSGHIDEYFALLGSGFLVGITYMILFFAFELWHIYLGIVVIAIGHAIDVSSWKILFYSNLPSEARGEVIGIYTTIMQIVYALAIVAAGFVGEIYGFEWTLLFAGIVTIFASIMLLFISDTKNKI